jgi:RNA polymerase sigma-70 factor, ECF subfamily
MSPGQSESELVPRAIAGDRAALSQLLWLQYDTLHDRIQTRISRDLQGVVRAEDILQLTFIRAARAIRSFQPRHPAGFHGWLRTIADNLLRDAHRQRRREPGGAARGQAAPAGDGPSDDGWVDQLPADQSSPSRRVGMRENSQRLLAAVSRLPDAYREVIQRRYLEGESLDEIARHLGSTKTAVRGLCYRARQRLRDSLGRSSLYFSG